MNRYETYSICMLSKDAKGIDEGRKLLLHRRLDVWDLPIYDAFHHLHRGNLELFGTQRNLMNRLPCTVSNAVDISGKMGLTPSLPQRERGH